MFFMRELELDTAGLPALFVDYIEKIAVVRAIRGVVVFEGQRPFIPFVYFSNPLIVDLQTIACLTDIDCRMMPIFTILERCDSRTGQNAAVSLDLNALFPAAGYAERFASFAKNLLNASRALTLVRSCPQHVVYVFIAFYY